MSVKLEEIRYVNFTLHGGNNIIKVKEVYEY